MTAGEDDEGGDVEMSSPEYCSLSDRIVTPDSAMGFGASSEDMVLAGRRRWAWWWEPGCSEVVTMQCEPRKKLGSVAEASHSRPPWRCQDVTPGLGREIIRRNLGYDATRPRCLGQRGNVEEARVIP